jgi:outer membrane lipoprotein-sorting protein
MTRCPFHNAGRPIVSVGIAALLLLSLVISPIAAEAQSARKIIERHIDAIGGKKAVERIVSAEMSGSIRTGSGQSGDFVQKTKRPNLLYISMSWGDSRWSTGFNGRAAWHADGIDGLRTLYGHAASRVRAEAVYATTRLVVSEKFSQVFLAQRDQVRGHPVTVLVAFTPDGMKRTLSFDAQTHLLVKDELQTDAGLEERFFDDYRRVGQVMEPHRIEWHRNGETFRIDVERVVHNETIDGATFDVPAPSLEPPLDTDAVLSAAARNEQRAGALANPYAYRQTTTHGRIDEDGRVTEEEGRTYEIVHLAGGVVARLIRNRGQALSEAEQRREDERVSSSVRALERQGGSGQPGPRTPIERGGSGSIIIWGPLGSAFPAYLRMSDFSNIRRERLLGRPVIVVEFQPKRGARPNGDLERQASKLAGTLWIDEASEHVIRIESYFSDDHNRNVRGSSVRMDRVLIDDAWLPSRFEMSVRRDGAFGRFWNSRSAVHSSDHRKFDVETDFTVTLPDAGR